MDRILIQNGSPVCSERKLFAQSFLTLLKNRDNDPDQETRMPSGYCLLWFCDVLVLCMGSCLEEIFVCVFIYLFILPLTWQSLVFPFTEKTYESF